jgi:peptidoglycan hydrolase-like protein with peptidoglycan-binding domain
MPIVAGVAIASVVEGLVPSRANASILQSPVLVSQLPAPVVLQRDDSGDAVSALQRRLSELGYYDGPISGYYGEMTEAAVLAFQQAQGLTADGVVGASTTEALRRAPSSASIPSPSGRAGLTIGSTGDEVSQLQRQLTDLGYYSGPISGYYGELTESAVREFQSGNGLAVDGVVGSSTLAALQQAQQPLSSSEPDPNDGLLEQGESGTDVAELQRRLKNLNYYNGAIDGDFGSLTADAVLRFQRAQGLTPDGVVGPATLAALGRLENGATQASTPSSSNNPSPPSFPAPSQSTTPATPPAQPSVVTPAPVTVPPPASQNSTFPPISSNPFPTVGTSPAPATTVPMNASSEAVMELQQRLQDQGFYNGPIDGVMGYETQQAIDAARNAYGINGTDFGTVRPF